MQSHLDFRFSCTVKQESASRRTRSLAAAHRKTIILLCGHFFAGFMPFIANAQTPSDDIPGAGEILERIARMREAMPPFAAVLLKTRKYEVLNADGSSVKEPTNLQTLSHYRQDGGRFDSRVLRHVTQGADQELQTDERTIWDGERFLDYYAVSGGNADRPRIFQGAEGDKERYVIAGNMPMREFLGHFGGDLAPFYDLLAPEAAALSVNATTIEGREAYLLEGQTTHGHYRIWLSAGDGHHLLKAESRKRGNDLWGRDPVTRFLQELTYEIYDVQIEEVNGRAIPVRSRYRYTKIAKDGTRSVHSGEFVLQEMERDPDFEAMGAFRLTGVPDGTSVRIFDAPAIAYEWRNGTVVPKVDPELLADLTDQIQEIERQIEGEPHPVAVAARPGDPLGGSPLGSRESSAPRWPLAWAWIAVAAAIAGGLGLSWWLHPRRAA